MRRRELIGGASLAGLMARPVLGQPGPAGGPVGMGYPLPGPQGYGGPGPGPAAGPSLDLNFLNGSPLDPRIVFTRASAASYFDVSGVRQQAAGGVPRFDFDPVTHAPRGLLIEEARTNYAQNSVFAGAVIGTPGTDPTGANFSVSLLAGLTKQIVATPVINGIQCVDVRFSGTTTGGSFFPQMCAGGVIATSSGIYWTSSAYLAVISGTLANIANLYLVANFAGYAGNTAVDTKPLLTAALTRYAGSGLAGTGTTGIGQPFFGFTVSSGAIDITVRVGAPQLETGPFVTSYIPTTTAAATRAADVATMPVDLWFNPAAGTLAATFVAPSSAAAINKGIVGFYNNTYFAFIDTFAAGGSGNSGFIFRNSNATYQALGGASLVPGATAKIAVTYTPSSWVKALNGAVIQSTGADPVPPGLTLLNVASPLAGGLHALNSAISRVRYWPRSLSNSELQAATT